MKNENTVEEFEWLDIDVMNGFKVTGAAKYCVNLHEVTVVLDGILTPEVKAGAAVIVGKLPETVISSSKLEVREVTLLSNGNVSNIVITAEGNVLFESHEDVESNTLFSIYKTYLIG